MAAARYWRLIGLAAWGRGDLTLRSVVPGNASGTAGAVSVSASHAPKSGTVVDLSNASNALPVTFDVSAVRSSGFHIVFDCGSAIDVDRLQVVADDDPETFVMLGSIQSSSDGESWSDAVSLAPKPFPGIGASLDIYAGSLPARLDQIALQISSSMADESIYNSALTMQGAVWQAGGKFGQYSLNTRAGHVLVAPNSAIQPFANDLTIEMWVKPRSSSSGGGLLALCESPSATYSGLRIEYASQSLLALTTFDGLSWANLSACVGGTFILNDWNYVEITRYGPKLFGALNGVDVIDFNIGASSIYSALTKSWIGRIANYSEGAPFDGEIGPMRVIVGKALRGAGGPLPVPTQNFQTVRSDVTALVPMLTPISSAIVCASELVPNFSSSLSRALIVRDTEFGGQGRIYGSTKIKGTPNVPTRARVVLLHQRSKLLVRETWSDATTGAFEFNGIDINQEFITLAEDIAGNFRPVAANKLVPEVLAS